MYKIKRYFQGVWKQAKMVRWPKKKEMITFSFATILIIGFFMVYFSCIDGILSAIVKVFS